MDIAIAPDDPALLAVVCLNGAGTLRREVYLSRDGGDSWDYAGVISWIFGGSEQIGDIVISRGYKLNGRLTHDIIVGSRQPSDGNGQGEVYILNYPSFSGWKAQGFASGDVIAIECSPNYTTDFTLVVMAATTGRTCISLGHRDVGANTCIWNSDSGWPVEICQPDQCCGNASGENRIITGEIALPTDFVGTSETKRIIFVTYDSNGTARGITQVLDDIYRLDNTRVNKLKLPGCGNTARVSTIAYSGTCNAGELLAGEVCAEPTKAAGRVWICRNPLAPCAVWKPSSKPPTGGGNIGYANAQLAWSPEGLIAFCGTGSGNRNTPQKWANPADPAWNSQNLDESAVSITQDSGESWNQVGLIDTRIDRLRSVAAAEDESALYLASVNNAGFDSLWRSRSPFLGEVWQRVMCLDGQSPILRLAPDTENGATVFWGNQGTSYAFRSTDYGQVWQDCFPNVIIQDMVASDGQKLYILQANGQVRRGKYTTGWMWGRNVDCDLNAAHTIAVKGDNVLVGAALGQFSPIAYSADGGQTWAKVIKQTPSSGNRHVAFDTNFGKNLIVYIADDAGGIYRWAVGRSNYWDDLEPPNNSFYGIAIGSGGAAYGAYSSNQTGVDRALYPRSGVPKPSVYWDSLALGGGVKFSLEPSSLSISKTTLWAIDDRNYQPLIAKGCLWAFVDTLARAGPWLIEPGGGVALGCDPVSGRNQEVDLKWEQLSLAHRYEIEIAKDDEFSLQITVAEPPTNPFYEPAIVTSPAYIIMPGTLPEAGATYYWHVRVRQAATGQVIRSQWSAERSFVIKAGLPVVSPYLGAQALKPSHDARGVSVSSVAFSWTAFKGVTEYKFVLAKDSALRKVLAEETVPTTSYKYGGKLDYNTSYFWQVTATNPVPGQPSPVFSFTTEGEAVPPSPPLPNYDWLLAIGLVNVLGYVIILATLVLLLRSRQM